LKPQVITISASLSGAETCNYIIGAVVVNYYVHETTDTSARPSAKENLKKAILGGAGEAEKLFLSEASTQAFSSFLTSFTFFPNIGLILETQFYLS
jgi:hypothetical protein